MIEVSYQKIFNILLDVVPENWHKIVFYAEYAEESYTMKYFVDTGTGSYEDCFDLNGISEDDILYAFELIDNEITPVRNELPLEQLWYVMTMVIDDSGSFKTEYEYTDISENSISYYQNWKKRYVK